MWDTVQDAGNADHLSRDMPCVRCGHAAHTFLACDEACACQPTVTPGDSALATV